MKYFCNKCGLSEDTGLSDSQFTIKDFGLVCFKCWGKKFLV